MVASLPGSGDSTTIGFGRPRDMTFFSIIESVAGWILSDLERVLSLLLGGFDAWLYARLNY